MTTLPQQQLQLQQEEDTSSLSSPSYDPLLHLNQIFPDSSSLSSLPAIQLHLSTHLHHLDTEIHRAAQARKEQQSALKERINELQHELEDLFSAVENVKNKAEKADGVMGQLTGGIRRLDGGKQNLTTSMTALKRLQMLSNSIYYEADLATAYEQLLTYSKSRQYKETAQLLQVLLTNIRLIPGCNTAHVAL